MMRNNTMDKLNVNSLHVLAVHPASSSRDRGFGHQGQGLEMGKGQDLVCSSTPGSMMPCPRARIRVAGGTV